MFTGVRASRRNGVQALDTRGFGRPKFGGVGESAITSTVDSAAKGRERTSWCALCCEPGGASALLLRTVTPAGSKAVLNENRLSTHVVMPNRMPITDRIESLPECAVDV